MTKAGFLELEHIEGNIFNVHLTKEQVDLVATFFAGGIMPLVHKKDKNPQEMQLAEEMQQILVALNRATNIVITAKDTKEFA